MPFATASIRLLCACACLLALAACTIPFTPGDAKPSVFTPYPAKAASSGGS